MKKILVVASDAGGTNALINPVSKIRDEDRVTLTLIGYSTARDILNSKGISFNIIQDYNIKNLQISSFNKIIDYESPDLVLTGVSLNNSEKYAIHAAKKASIPSISLLPGHPPNYVLIFSDYDLKEPFKYIPDYICISDKYSLKDMIKVGFPLDKLVITGNPYYDDLFNLQNSFTQEEANKFKVRLSISENNYVVTFVSQYNLARMHNDKNYNPGYTEIDSLRISYKELRNILKDDLFLIVKLHLDKKEKLKSTKKAIPNNPANVVFLRDDDTLKHIIISDLVLGMTSNPLFGAIYLDKDVVSVQPNLIGQDTLITNRLGLSVPVYTEKNLKPTLEKIIFDKEFKKELKQRRSNLKLDGKSTERVVDFIYKMLGV